MAVMQAVQDHTHAFPCCDECRDTKDPTDDRQHSPGTTRRAECDEQVCNEGEKYACDAQTSSKDHTRPIAVTNGPADEVRMGLFPQGILNRLRDIAKGRRMSSVLQSMEYSLSFFRREIELAGTVFGDVDADDPCYFFTVRLSRDWIMSVLQKRQQFWQYKQGFHFMPASSNACSAAMR